MSPPEQFSGTLIRDLCDDVERAMFDPAIFLASVQTHLADRAAVHMGDRAAYIICHDIQDCLFSGRPIPTYLICFGCGRPTMIYPAAEVSDMVEYMKKSFLCDLCDGGY